MSAIRELLERMKHGDFHKARGEAARLADLGLLEEIKAILEATKDLADKLHCYWILCDLGRNARAPQVAEYLTERAAREKTARMRKQALLHAQFIEGPWNPEHAIAALSDKNRDLRHTAIQALGACTDPRAEEALMGIVEGDADADPAATRYAAEGLARNGTGRCAESLVSLVRRLPCNGYHEVTISAALLGLARLGRPDALPLAADGLAGWRYNHANWARMLYVAQFGDERHIDPVIDRLKSIVQRPKRENLTYAMTFVKTRFDDELSAGVSFLLRFKDERIDGFFPFLRDHAAALFDEERQRLATLLPLPAAKAEE